MRAVRWVLLLLYVALVVGLFGLGLAAGDPGPALVLLAVTVTAHAVFILGAGHKDLCRPVRRPRLLLPLAAAAFMMAVLVVGLAVALAELLRTKGGDGGGYWLWAWLGASWLFWGVVLYGHTRRLPRLEVISRLARLVFAGSIAEMLAAVPSHIVVKHRGGCFAGLGTGIGIMAGLCVMIWSFGPGIFLLFVEAAHRRRTGADRDASAETARRPAPFQFGLRTLLLVVSGTSVVCGLLRTYWGHDAAAGLAALVVLAVLSTVLAARPRLLAAACLAVVPGLAWAFWGDWTMLGVLAPTAGMLLVLVVRLYGRRPAPVGEASNLP